MHTFLKSLKNFSYESPPVRLFTSLLPHFSVDPTFVRPFHTAHALAPAFDSSRLDTKTKQCLFSVETIVRLLLVLIVIL